MKRCSVTGKIKCPECNIKVLAEEEIVCGECFNDPTVAERVKNVKEFRTKLQELKGHVNDAMEIIEKTNHRCDYTVLFVFVSLQLLGATSLYYFIDGGSFASCLGIVVSFSWLIKITRSLNE